MNNPQQKLTLKLYQPHEVQRAFHESQARYRVACWGRQSGKSTAALNEMLRRAWKNPGSTIWFVSPTSDQALVQYRRMVSMLMACPEVLGKRPNQTEKRIRLINSSQCVFKSGESLQNLRGETLHGAVIDEVREQDPLLWRMVIRPMLGTTKGWAAFVSTSNGFDAFYDIYERGRLDTSGTWETFTAPSTANPKFSQDEYDAARADMSEAEFAQEILAEFRNIHSGKAYRAEGSHNEAMSSPFCAGSDLISPYIPVVVGLDFNVNPMAWTLGQHRNGDWYWFDEVHIADTNTIECAPELVSRLISLRDRGFLNARPNVILCGDSTGESRNTKATESDYAIITGELTRAGITWENRTPAKNPPVKARVNTMNAKLRAADGSVHFWYHPINCKFLKKDLQRVAWKEGAQTILDQTTDSSLTHSSDSVGYPIVAMSPIEQEGSVGTLRMIRR